MVTEFGVNERPLWLTFKQEFRLGLIIILVFLFSLCYAECPINESDIGRCLIAYFKDIDLNNDSRLESVKVIAPCRIITNISDAEWGDDAGIIIKIIDGESRDIFWNEVVRLYDEVINVSIEDINADYFKEVLISVRLKNHETKTYIYGWKDGAYRYIIDSLWQS